MAKKDGRENLVPIESRSTAEARAISARGGVNSGKTRKRKADVKKTITEILNNTYTNVNKDGSVTSVTGIEAIMINLFKMATDPKSRNSVQAIKLILELYQGNQQTKEEKRLMNAQITLMEAKAKSMSAIEELNVEDLAPLARLLNVQGKELDAIDTNAVLKDVTPHEEDTAD